MRREAVLLLCVAIPACGGGRQVPDGYLTKGRVACSLRLPPLDVGALVGHRLDDARRFAWNHDCVLMVLIRDGERANAVDVIAPKVDVAVADGKVIGVKPHADR